MWSVSLSWRFPVRSIVPLVGRAVDRVFLALSSVVSGPFLGLSGHRGLTGRGPPVSVSCLVHLDCYGHIQ